MSETRPGFRVDCHPKKAVCWSVMWLDPIQVECHSGFRADEEPRRFLWRRRRISVIAVVDRWYQVQSLPEWPRADYFRVTGDDGLTHILKHDLESDEWFVGAKAPGPDTP